MIRCMPEMNAQIPPLMSHTCLDLFCTVIDNFGDIGVCRRLALQLHSVMLRENSTPRSAES